MLQNLKTPTKTELCECVGVELLYLNTIQNSMLCKEKQHNDHFSQPKEKRIF